MKNFIFTVAALLVGGVAFAGDCENGVCRKPVRNTVAAVVTAPVRVTKRTVENLHQRRVARRSCHTCN